MGKSRAGVLEFAPASAVGRRFRFTAWDTLAKGWQPASCSGHGGNGGGQRDSIFGSATNWDRYVASFQVPIPLRFHCLINLFACAFDFGQTLRFFGAGYTASIEGSLFPRNERRSDPLPLRSLEP